jgi:hypothetical protein
MPTVRDFALQDVLSAIEDWKTYDAGTPADIFIAALGFEDRAPHCFEQWCCANNQNIPRIAVLIDYPFNKADNANQEVKFASAAAASKIDIHRINYRSDTIFGELVALFRRLNPQNAILLDLSSMASFVFYPLMAALFEEAKGACLRICYTEATKYFPEQSEWAAFQAKFATLDLVDRARLFDEYHFQSKGIETVFESLNFPGRNPNNLPTDLVIIPSFSTERVHRMINFAVDSYSVNREDCDWIIGVPPNNEKNGWRNGALYELFDKPNSKHDACTLNFKDVVLALQAIWDAKHQSRSLVIASIASKAQHLGTFLFLKMHPDVGLILSEPTQFTVSKYSSGVGQSYEVNLDKISELNDRLLKWNQIIFEW